MTARLEIGSQFGGYVLEQELGRGGMGVVYLAQQLNLSRRVALKVMTADLSGDEDFRARFEREARLAASIDHPNVVPVFDAGSVDDYLYLAMRYVEGTDLAKVIMRWGRLSEAHALSAVAQVAAALDAAHAAGLVHRDVKPANVLLAGESEDSHAYLTDFGLTKELESAGPSLTHTGQWVGTLDYVAPEQMEGRPTDARTDVYALGCVLFHCLTGRTPYQGGDVQKMWGHVHGDLPTLHDTDPGLASRFDPVISRAIAKDPDQRFPSAGDLARAAGAAASGAIVAVPERSVATGAAAFGRPDSIPAGAPTARAPAQAPAAAGPPWQPAPPDHAELPTRPLPPGAERPRGRSPWPIVAAVLALLLLAGGVGGAFLLAGSNDEPDPPPVRGGSTPEAQRSQSGSAGSSGATGSDDTSFRRYSPTQFSGFTARIPTGDGWSEPVEESQNSGRRLSTQLEGPRGTTLIIHYTPSDRATGPDVPGATTRTIDQPAFGSATEYTFKGGDIPQCQSSTCVDYIVNDDTANQGFAVLVAGDDLAFSKRIGTEVTTSLATEPG